MTFLAPLFLLGAFVIAAGIIGLHFIVIRPPRSAVLPTARFVPETRATTVASASRPSDWLLMALRVLTVLAAGAGLAKPVFEPGRRATAGVILVDVSRSVRDTAALHDSLQAVYRDGDAVVLFDSAIHTMGGRVRDSLSAIRPTSKRGNLSAALIAALRAGSSMRESADSLQLSIVSPFAAEEFDAATDSIRRLWRGRARVIQVAADAPKPQSPTTRLNFDADAGDPLAIAVDRLRATVAGNATIYRRDTSNESLSGDVITVSWPTSARPSAAVARNIVDTVGGVTGAGGQVIAPFERRWLYPIDSIRGATVIARWVDGEPAAIERDRGASCIRSVAIPVTPIGDLVIRNDFIRFVSALAGPCASHAAIVPAGAEALARLAGNGALAPGSAFQPRTEGRSSLAPWLFALALLTSIAELLLRRRQRGQATTASHESRGEARAA
jgi:hypothetical protein